MKYLVILLVIYGPTEKTWAQSVSEIKSMLESHFGGTTLRDIATGFELKRDSVNKRYALTGDIRQLVEPVVIKRVQQEINRLFAQSDSTGYTGTVYFDRYIDRRIYFFRDGG